MIRALPILACLVAIAPPLQDREPPMLFTLECDGKLTTIEADTPQDVATAAGRMKVTLRPLPYRVFGYGGVSFHYPRSFGFQQQAAGPGMTQWMLVGDKYLISVLQKKDEPDAAKWLKDTEDATVTLHKNAKRSDVELEIGGTKVKGARVEHVLAGMDMKQSSYVFQVGGDAVMITLHDGPTTKAKRSEAAEEAEKLFRETFRMKPM